MERQTAAGYVRVSTTMQATEGLSIDQQEAQVAAYIEAHDWELAGVYVERGVSGKLASRPELDKLLASLDEIDYLVIPKLDRLGRSTKNVLEIVERLEAADVALVSIKDNIDSTGFGRFQLTLLSALAELEAATGSERTGGVIRAHVEAGGHHGNTPYGYEKVDKQLVPVEPAASVVRRIFQESAEGVPQRKLAKKLNDEKVRRDNGAQWGQSTIGKMLSCRTYIGEVIIDGESFPGKHERIINQEVWDKVHALKAIKAERAPKGGGGRKPKHHLFEQGHLACAHCGKAMLPCVTRKGYEYYQCRSRAESGAASCVMENVPREVVDSAVFGYFEAVGIDLDATRAQLVADAEARRLEVIGRLRDVTRADREAGEAVERVSTDYMAGKINADEWKLLKGKLDLVQREARENLDAARDAADAAAEAEQRVADSEETVVQGIAQIRAAISGEVQAAGDLEKVRGTLLRLFENFYIRRASQPTRTATERAAMAAQEAGVGSAPDLWAAEPSEQGWEDDVQPFAAGEWEITPVPRLEAVEGLDVTWRPILRREAIGLNNDDQTTVSDSRPAMCVT